MQLSYDTTWRTLLGRAGIFLLIGLFTSQSVYARASKQEVMKFFMSKPGFSGAVAAVANLNAKMRQAAQNPMDDWRRDEVIQAYAALHPAIINLAKTFQQGELHDGDYPFVRDTLGGFIDVSFLGKAKEFLANPSMDKIPSLGQDFPSGSLEMQDSDRPGAPGEGASGIKYTETNRTGSPNVSDGVTNASGNLVDLSGLSPEKPKAADAGDADGKKVLVMVEDLDKAEDGGGAGSANGESELTPTTVSEEVREETAELNEAANRLTQFNDQLDQQLRYIEREVASQEGLTEEEKAAQEKKKKEDEGVFNLTEHLKELEEGFIRHEDGEGAEDEEKTEEAKEAAQEAEMSEAGENNVSTPKAPRTSKLTVQPKYWNPARMTVAIGDLFIPKAAAEGAGAALAGVGAIIAPAAQAAAQAGVAAVNADRDKYIASVSADAAIKQTSIQAETTKQLAANQAAVAAMNTQATVAITKASLEAGTERLGMQLAALQHANDAAREERAQIREQEQRELDLQLQVAKMTANMNYEIAKLKMKMNYLNLNNVASTDTSIDSRLNVTRLGSATGENRSSGGTYSFSRTGGTQLGVTPSHPLSAPKTVDVSLASDEEKPRARSSVQLFRALTGSLSPRFTPTTRFAQNEVRAAAAPILLSGSTRAVRNRWGQARSFHRPGARAIARVHEDVGRALTPRHKSSRAIASEPRKSFEGTPHVQSNRALTTPSSHGTHTHGGR